MSDPLISVVLPFYNREDVLGEAIRSVLEQTFTDLELILVDDGSTDQSPDVARSLRDERLRHHRLPTNRGVSAARNAGIALARGRFLAFQDSDDRWLPDKLRAQLDLLWDRSADRSRTTVVGCGWRPLGATAPRKDFGGRAWWPRQAVLAGCVSGLGTPMLLVDRRGAHACRFDERLPALVERDFVLNALGSHGQVAVVPEVLVEVRKGRADHVAQAARTLPALEHYLVKYAAELRDDPGARAWYHYQAFREALRTGSRDRSELHAMRLAELGIRSAGWMRVAYRVFGELGLAAFSRLPPPRLLRDRCSQRAKGGLQ
jgi:glycosyltransferase involved in cell wall biosynthesis